MQICWRKVPDCADTPFFQLAGERTRILLRNGQRCNVNLMGLDKFLQLVHHFDLYAMYSETFKTWVGIKNTDNLKTDTVKVIVS